MKLWYYFLILNNVTKILIFPQSNNINAVFLVQHVLQYVFTIVILYCFQLCLPSSDLFSPRVTPEPVTYMAYPTLSRPSQLRENNFHSPLPAIKSDTSHAPPPLLLKPKTTAPSHNHNPRSQLFSQTPSENLPLKDLTSQPALPEPHV